MCGCRRSTYLCQCRHKERIIERCHVYQLREAGSCWAWCFPMCRTTVRRHRLQRVCRECDDYFLEKYGDEHYKRFIQFFLEYKDSKGWGKTAIDPRTVPREVLLKRQSAPPRLGNQMDRRVQARGQPYQINQPMVLTTAPAIRQRERRPTPANDNDRSPGPAAGMSRRPARQPVQMNPQLAPAKRAGTPFPHERTPSPHGESRSVIITLSPSNAHFLPPKVSGGGIKRLGPSYIPNKDNPLPTDPSLFVVEDDEEEDDDSDEAVGKERVFTPSPVPKYESTKLPPGLVVVPELAHLDQGRRTDRVRYRRSFLEIEQPAPKTYKVPKESMPLRNADSLSDISLVKKLTKIARDIDIPNIDYIEYQGKLVPILMTPPPGRRRTRTPTPPPTAGSSDPDAGPYSYNGTEAIDIAIAANAVPDSLIPGKGEAGRQDGGATRSPSTYFVTTRADAYSPTGASARVHRSPSHERIVIPPPQRLDGVLIPSACPHHHHNHGKGNERADCMACRGSFFKERGLPSQTYVQQECRSAALAPHSPMLVSVHVPERRYSCAVQSCYCNDENDENNKCPSCRERDSIARELHTAWI
ncbi:hypothetical protein F4823DRAFT_591269 [Ustulina deusta]|nr:hypothetical protein F4823DRAFT_591269 [Ustulina deusta]